MVDISDADNADGAIGPIVSERLYTRCWHADQPKPAFEIYGDPIAMRFMHPNYPVADVAAMRVRLGEIIERNVKYEGRMGSWPLFTKTDDALVGAILLKPLPDSDLIEVGWHLARSAMGQWIRERKQAGRRWCMGLGA